MISRSDQLLQLLEPVEHDTQSPLGAADLRS
jgi:hypothetical protein